MKKTLFLLTVLCSCVALCAQEKQEPNWGAKDNARFDYQNNKALEIYAGAGYNFMSFADKSISEATDLKQIHDMWVNVGLNYMFKPYVKLGLDVVYNPSTNLYNRKVTEGRDMFRNSMNVAFGPVAYYSPIDEFKPERKGKWFALWLFAGLHVNYYGLDTENSEVSVPDDLTPWGLDAILGLQADFRITDSWKFYIRGALDQQLALGLANPSAYHGTSPKYLQGVVTGGFAVSFPTMAKKSAEDQAKEGARQDWLTRQDTVYITDTVINVISDTVWISEADFSGKEKVGSMTIDFAKYNTQPDEDCQCDMDNPDMETAVRKMLDDTSLTIALHGYAYLRSNGATGMESLKCARQIKQRLIKAGVAADRIYIYYCKDTVTSNAKKALWVEADFYREKDN